jgi:hypothetical protein
MFCGCKTNIDYSEMSKQYEQYKKTIVCIIQDAINDGSLVIMDKNIMTQKQDDLLKEHK